MIDHRHSSKSSFDWFTGGGECGAILRAFDWSSSSIGAPDGWPAQVRGALALLLASRQSMCLTVGKDRLRFYNDAYAPMMGDRHPRALGTTASVGWGRATAHLGPLLERAFLGEAIQLEDEKLKFESRQGIRIAYVSFSFTPVRDDRDEVVAVFGICQDTTQKVLQGRRNAASTMELERAVAERTRAYASVIQSLEAAVCLNRHVADSMPGIATFWDERLRCRFANQAFYDWCGRTPEEVIGFTRQEIYGPNSRLLSGKRHEDALKGAAQCFEFTANPESPVPQTFQVYNVPARNERGSVIGVFSMAFDITEHKRIEAELKRSNSALLDSRDAAESATRAKSAFVANMSHEIRTPLNAIMGLTHLLGRDPQDDMQRERLEKIGEAGHHLLRIVNDILDISKIEAGKLILEEHDFSLEAMLDLAVGMVAPRALEKGLSLTVDTNHASIWLRGDSMRLSQMVLNLLSNAVKFTATGSVRLVSTLTDKDDGAIELRCDVKDTGIGVARDLQAKLFNPFEQGDHSTTRRFGGTGLGLSLVKKLAIAMNGSVRIVSDQGLGSEFSFTVVLNRSRPADRSSAAASPNSWRARMNPARALASDEADSRARLQALHSGQRLLLAEDNAVNREVAAELLRSAGLEVDLAFDGMAATKMALSRHYDLILLDVQMPVHDGLQAAAAIRAELGASLPIIAMTANALTEDRARCLAAGMDDHVTKPVDPALLYAVLLRWLPVPQARPERPAADGANSVDSPGIGFDEGLMDALTRVEALDARKGLSNVGMQTNFYRQVLVHFAELYSRGVLAFVQESTLQNRAEWLRCAHSLTGASSVVGADRLVDSVTRLSSMLRAGATPIELMDQGAVVHSEVKRLAAAIGQALGS